jgi:hypothetical protein
MDRVALYRLLVALRPAAADEGQLPGLLHLLLRRRVTLEDGTPVLSPGELSRPQLAEVLPMANWRLPPGLGKRGTVRDHWRALLRRARVDSAKAREAADRLAEGLAGLGYVVAPWEGG